VTAITILGYPGDRRVLGFTAACRAEGLRPPRVLSWASLLDGSLLDGALLDGALHDGAAPAEGPDFPGLLRVDSPGEDPVADALLRGPGDPARVGGGARWHATLTAALERLRAAAGPGLTWLSDPGDIAVMFDKRRCHARLHAAGVPVPGALPPVDGYRALRDAMAQAGWERVFVKPAHGSSASGVVALAARGGRVRAVSSAVPAPGGGYVNSLKVARYEREPAVAGLIDALAADGLHVERWVPKAGVHGRAFDLRVVVTGGTPTHAVARTSRTPITNLHLGGQRGDLAAVRELLGPARWRQALDVCAQAAACFPATLMAGVDLLADTGLRRFLVGEVNAFGDLLPGLTGLPGGPAEGLDTYTTQVRAVTSGLDPGQPWKARTWKTVPCGT
jgi:glutathione synthase/RimK-type ligase-like ATP-grasp enzyme